MKVLSFDSSSKTLSVAVLDDKDLLADVTINIKKNHSITLMPAIDFLMQSIDLNPADLDRIVVAQGPGSYTGLRIAVATAKMLAYSLKIDLVGASSLYALAGATEFDGLLVPIIDARRNNVYAGFYENGRAVQGDQHMAFETVLEIAKKYTKIAFVGEVDHFRDQIAENIPHAQMFPTLPSAYEIGKMGQDLEPVDVDAFVPTYLKRVEAEENWLKDHKELSAQDYIKRV